MTHVPPVGLKFFEDYDYVLDAVWRCTPWVSTIYDLGKDVRRGCQRFMSGKKMDAVDVNDQWRG